MLRNWGKNVLRNWVTRFFWSENLYFFSVSCIIPNITTWNKKHNLLQTVNIMLERREVKKEKVMSAMQAFSKAMFMPVLIPSYCNGLLIAVGNVLTNARLRKSYRFLTIR